MRVVLEVAGAAIGAGTPAGLVDGDLDRAIADAVFDRAASCVVQGRCLCAPGVVTGRLSYRWGPVVVRVDRLPN